MRRNDHRNPAVERPLIVSNGQPDLRVLEARIDANVPTNSLKPWGNCGDAQDPCRYIHFKEWTVGLTYVDSLKRVNDRDFADTNMDGSKQVHVFTSFNGMIVDQKMTKDEMLSKLTFAGIVDCNYTLNEPAQPRTGVGLMLQGFCSVILSGTKAINPFSKVEWDVPYWPTDKQIENAPNMQAAWKEAEKTWKHNRMVTNSVNTAWRMDHNYVNIKAFDVHQRCLEESANALAEVLKPFLAPAQEWPEFALLAKGGPKKPALKKRSKMYMTGLSMIKRDLSLQLLAELETATEPRSGALRSACEALARGATNNPTLITMLQIMCRTVYRPHLQTLSWFSALNYAAPTNQFAKELQDSLAGDEQYSLYSTIEAAHKRVFAVSTDFALPGQQLRIML